MKSKTLNILTIIACGYLLLSGFSQISVQFPSYLIMSDLGWLEIRYIPMALAVTYIMLAIFVLVKNFIKNIFITRITGLFLGISGVLLVLSEYSYLSQAFYPVISRIKYLSFSNYMILFENFILLFCALLAIFICLNTFRSFVSNKLAFIITLSVIGLAFIINILHNATIPIGIYKNIRYLTNFFIIDIMNYPALFLVNYIALKPVIAEKENKGI